MLISGCGEKTPSEVKNFLNVSYDPPRELYTEYNEKFHEHWTKELGKGEVGTHEKFKYNLILEPVSPPPTNERD